MLTDFCPGGGREAGRNIDTYLDRRPCSACWPEEGMSQGLCIVAVMFVSSECVEMRVCVCVWIVDGWWGVFV